MANELAKTGDSEIKEAYAAKDIAQTLKKYMTTGGHAEENDLVEKLNENPGFFQRFFPTSGQKIAGKVNAETLQQIRKNKSEIMAAHHAMYLESVKLQAQTIIKGLGVHLQEQLSMFVLEKIENIQANIASSQGRMLERIMEQYADAEKFINNNKVYEAAIKSADKHLTISMEATEELLNGTISALKNKGGVSIS